VAEKEKEQKCQLIKGKKDSARTGIKRKSKKH